MSLSFGTPVVAPALGPFPELISSDVGLLFEPEEGGLARALGRVRQLDLPRASEAARRLAEERNWARVAAEHVAAYGAITGRS